MTRELPEGTVTLLFTDVVASTTLGAQRGDTSAQGMLRGLRELVRAQIAANGGHELKTMGDGFMVVFASARRGVACAVAIQRALAEHNFARPGSELGVRIGLNTGEATLEEQDYFGLAVDAAQRVMSKARGGQILISDTVRAVLGRSADVRLVDRGRFRLKGFPERWRLFEVLWQDEPEAPAATPAFELTPFIGRAAEKARMLESLARAIAGRGSLILVSGEPGVGKTRLTHEIIGEARGRGVIAFAGRCYDDAGTPPYVPFVEIIEAAARGIPRAAFREALGEALTDVARVVPSLARIFADAQPPAGAPGDQLPRHVLSGIVDFLTRASSMRPVMLVLDDLHWSDDSTLLLLRRLAAMIDEIPVLIVGTLRDVEPGVSPAVARILSDLQRERASSSVRLRPFDAEGVAEMLRALSAHDPPRRIVEAIAAASEGNAFFIEELIRHLADAGGLFDQAGAWREDAVLATDAVPHGARLLIERRIERLSDAARTVLPIAAVAGRAFTFDLLEQISDVRGDRLMDVIDETERAGIIRALSRAADTPFSFAHELTRHALLDALPTAQRQRFHLQVAETIEHLYAHAIEEHAGDLAHHYRDAGRLAAPVRVIAAARRAGDAALAMQANPEAEAHYREALHHIGAGAGDQSERAYMLHKLAQAEYRLGRWDESAASLDDALALYATLGLAAERAEVLHSKAVLCTFRAQGSEALELLRAAQEAATGDRLRGLIAQLEAQNLVQLRRYDDAAEAVREAMAIAEAAGDPYVTVRAHMASGYLSVSTLDMVAGERAYGRALATPHISTHERTACESRRADALASLGRLDEAERQSHAATDFFRRMQDPFELGLSFGASTMTALIRGRFDDAVALAEQGVRDSGDPPNIWVLMSLMPAMLQVRYLRAEFPAADALIRTYLEPMRGRRRLPAIAYSYRALESAARGAPPEEALRDISPAVLHLAPDRLALTDQVILAETAVVLGDAMLAESCFDGLCGLHGRGLLFTPGWVVLVPRLLGAMCLLRGDRAEAARYLGESVDVATHCDARPELAMAHMEMATLCMTDDPGASRDRLAEARRLFSSLAVPVYERRLTHIEQVLAGEVIG